MKPAMASAPLPALKALLLDLDGTLVDTAPDMALALNLLLRDHGAAPLPLETVRPKVSHGAAALVELGFGETPASPRFDKLRDAFLGHYARHIADRSALFDGMEKVLGDCESSGIRWGVVTNKPGALTDALLRELDLDRRAACVVSGDTISQRKPHPAPVLHACMLLRLAPSDCVVVGDAERDIQSGARAGARTAVARWGYISADDRPDNWGAQHSLADPYALADYVRGPS